MQRYHQSPRIEIKLAQHRADPGIWRLGMATRRPSSILFQERGNRPAEDGWAPSGAHPHGPIRNLRPMCQGPGATWVLGPCAASLGPSIYAEQWCRTRPGLRNALRRQRLHRELDSRGDEQSVPKSPSQIRPGHRQPSRAGTEQPRRRKHENRFCMRMQRENDDGK